MRGSVFVMLSLIFLALILARELCQGCDMFFSPTLTQNHAWLLKIWGINPRRIRVHEEFL
jgi:hypothetical protein